MFNTRQVSRYQQGFPGAMYWGICFRGEGLEHFGLEHFGEDHSSNCFVDNGIGGYILAYTGKVTYMTGWGRGQILNFVGGQLLCRWAHKIYGDLPSPPN